LNTSLALVTAAVLVSSSSLADTAILVSLPSELDSVRREVRLVGQPIGLAQHKVSIGYRKGEKLYIVRTGAGNLNSAMVTEGLLAKWKVDRVISIGVAGYLGESASGTTEIPRQARNDNLPSESRKLNADSFRIGDVFIATDVVSHQQGKETPAGFDVKQEPEARGQKLEEYWSKCGELRSNAMEIAQSLLRSGGGTTNGTTEIPRQARNDKKEEKLRDFATLREGRLVSGDSFIASSEKHKWLRETFHADAVDMVSLGIARVCEANGVPYVIIRTLSDNANESASADFATFVQKYNEPVTATIAVGIIDRVAAATPRSPAK
jgi:adenosylhomocysteine nucleosidase